VFFVLWSTLLCNCPDSRLHYVSCLSLCLSLCLVWFFNSGKKMKIQKGERSPGHRKHQIGVNVPRAGSNIVPMFSYLKIGRKWCISYLNMFSSAKVKVWLKFSSVCAWIGRRLHHMLAPGQHIFWLICFWTAYFNLLWNVIWTHFNTAFVFTWL